MTKIWLASLAAVPVVAGCDRGAPSLSEPPDLNVPGAPCYRSLRVYCGSNGCVDYGTALTELRASASTRPFCFAQVGICDGYRVLVESRGFGASRRYYDAEGHLAAATEESDAVDPACRGLFHWGPVPDCQFQVVEDLCPRR